MNRNKNNINGKPKFKKQSTAKGGTKKFNGPAEEKYFQQKTENHATDYFSDAQLAEQNSYVSNRNIADAGKPIYDTDIYYPTIVAHAYNPCPSSTTYSIANGVVTPSTISIAATKLLTAIIANTGRVKNYTRTDISFLILAIGQFIAMTEFGRRCFGLQYKFSDINRDIPDQFLEACGIDAEDFRQNRATYISQFNYWIDLSNQIVIPMEKIPYFRRSRDMYKYVYRDLAGGQTVYHINVPYSTWILDEDAVPGARLMTVNVTGPHEYMMYDAQNNAVNPASQTGWNDTNVDGGVSYRQPHAIWTFGDFITNVYAPLVSSLLYSDTFNEIYADLRNTKFTSQYSFEFWHADMVSDDYQAEIKDADDMLVLYHNTMRAGVPVGTADKFDTNTAQLAITAWNDVVEDASTDTLVHNPVFLRHTYGIGPFTAATDTSSASTVVEADHIIMDFKETNPSLDMRVDCMMQKYYQDYVDVKVTTESPTLTKYYGKINNILPLYYAVQDYTYTPGWEKAALRVAGTPITVKGSDFNNGWYPLSIQEYRVIPYAVSAASVTAHSWGYDVATAQWVQSNQDFANLVTNSGATPVLRYVNGSPICEVCGIYTTRSSNDTIYYLSQINGNVDNWYKLPSIKLYNMFNHAFQHLFTAEGILK